MIEAQYRKSPYGFPSDWFEVSEEFDPGNANFTYYRFKLDGVIFEYRSKEFEKAAIWYKLRNPHIQD